MTGQSTPTPIIILAKVTETEENKGFIIYYIFVNIFPSNILLSICSAFVLALSKNCNFYTPLEAIGLTMRPFLSLVCSNFSVIIHTYETSHKIKTCMSAPSKPPLSPRWIVPELQKQDVCWAFALNERRREKKVLATLTIRRRHRAEFGSIAWSY